MREEGDEAKDLCGGQRHSSGSRNLPRRELCEHSSPLMTAGDAEELQSGGRCQATEPGKHVVGTRARGRGRRPHEPQRVYKGGSQNSIDWWNWLVVVDNDEENMEWDCCCNNRWAVGDIT